MTPLIVGGVDLAPALPYAAALALSRPYMLPPTGMVHLRTAGSYLHITATDRYTALRRRIPLVEGGTLDAWLPADPLARISDLDSGEVELRCVGERLHIIDSRGDYGMATLARPSWADALDAALTLPEAAPDMAPAAIVASPALWDLMPRGTHGDQCVMWRAGSRLIAADRAARWLWVARPVGAPTAALRHELWAECRATWQLDGEGDA